MPATKAVTDELMQFIGDRSKRLRSLLKDTEKLEIVIILEPENITYHFKRKRIMQNKILKENLRRVK